MWSAPPTADAVTQARGVVHETVCAWGLPDCLQPAVAVTAELVANAVAHAATPLELRLYHHDGLLRVEVADRDPYPPRLTPPTLDEPRHRGLVIVDAFAVDWGTRTGTAGKTVWAELDADPATALS